MMRIPEQLIFLSRKSNDIRLIVCLSFRERVSIVGRFNQPSSIYLHRRRT